MKCGQSCHSYAHQQASRRTGDQAQPEAAWLAPQAGSRHSMRLLPAPVWQCWVGCALGQPEGWVPAHQRRSPVPHCTPEHGSLQGLEAAHVHLLLRAAVALAAGERTGPCWGVPAAAGDRAASSARLQGDQAAWAGPEAVQACCPEAQVGLAGLAAFVGVLEVQACQATAVMRNYHISRHSAPMLLSRWRTAPEDTSSCNLI